MQTREYDVSDIDQAFPASSELGEFAGEYVQLSPGNLGFRACEFTRGAVTLRTYLIGQAVHCRDAMVSGDFLTAILLASPRPVLWNGREAMPGDHIEFQPNVEYDYVLPAGAEVMEISAPAPHAVSCRWKKSSDAVTQIPRAKLGALQDASRDWLQASSRSSSRNPVCQKDAVAAQILSRMSEILDSDRSSMTTEARTIGGSWIVDSAREFLRTSADAGQISVPWLAQNLGVSERTLYYAFQNHLGVSPHRYFIIRRLHQIRRLLLDTVPRPGVVTRAAMGAGFDDLSRMGQMYRKHFGETPRQTLRRIAHT